MSSYSTTHDGLERVLEGTRVLTHAVGPTRSLRTVPLIVLTGIVTAVVAVASRQFADAHPKGVMRRASSPGSSSPVAQGGTYTEVARTQT